MPTTPERTAGRRLALVVATGAYADPTLAKLRAPGRDATDLASVLEDAAVGGFEVESVLDAPTEELRRRVARFCAEIGPGDLALVYLSCHGVLDDRGRLYYATTDTDHSLLSATAVSSAWLNEQLEDSRGRRQILMLDCCHSGAFAKGTKGESNLALAKRFEGRGRVVLTGSRGTEYSFEHDDVVGDGAASVFTGSIVEGLRSGAADRDGDGLVTVNELYEYVYDEVRAREARQTPTLWTYGAEGDLLVARSPRGATAEPPAFPPSVPPPPPAGAPGAVDPPPGRARTRPPRRQLALVGGAAVLSALLAALLLLAGSDEKPAAAPSPGPLSVPGSPRAIAAGEDAVWVGRYEDDKVERVDFSSQTESIGVGRRPARIAAGEGSVWVGSDDGWALERAEPPPPNGEGTSLVECGCKITKLVLAEGKLWVGSAKRHAIVSFDPQTGRQISAPYSPGPEDFGGVFAVGGGAVWAVGWDTAQHQAWVSRTDLDLNASSKKRVGLEEAGPHLDAVAFGHETLWIADATDGRNTVIAFDPGSETVVKEFKISGGVTSDDLAVADDAVLFWDPDGGLLTVIDPERMEIAGTEPVEGFAGNPVNHEWSDLAVAEGLAWITDPASGKVLKHKYKL
jgi:uncharacterized caspase-like protein